MDSREAQVAVEQLRYPDNLEMTTGKSPKLGWIITSKLKAGTSCGSVVSKSQVDLSLAHEFTSGFGFRNR